MSKQEQINYADVMELGFCDEQVNDSVHMKMYGYPASNNYLELTDTIYVDWDKVTRLCKIVRVNNPKDCTVIKQIPVINLNQLKLIINFYKD